MAEKNYPCFVWESFIAQNNSYATFSNHQMNGLHWSRSFSANCAVRLPASSFSYFLSTV